MMVGAVGNIFKTALITLMRYNLWSLDVLLSKIGLVGAEYFIHRHNKNTHICKINTFSASHPS